MKRSVSRTFPLQVSKQGVLPIFCLEGEQYRPKKETRHRTAVSPAQVVADDLATYWGSSPFGLDASAIHAHPSAAPLLDIAAHARQAGISLIPATRLSAHPTYQTAVAQVHRVDGRGAVLRVDLQGMTSAANWVSNWPIPLEETDLVVDCANNNDSVLALGQPLAHAFAALYSATRWRSVTAMGSAMPDNFGGYQAGLYTIPRTELQIWAMLTQASLSYRLDFGDYATIPVNAATGEIAWGFPINVRYTLPNDFMICRGVPTTGYNAQDMDQQLLRHASAIQGHPMRHRLNCWADDKIDNIAAALESPGNLETWVQIGVNRHITLTRHILP